MNEPLHESFKAHGYPKCPMCEKNLLEENIDEVKYINIEIGIEIIESLSKCMDDCASEGLCDEKSYIWVSKLRRKFNLPIKWWEKKHNK